MQSAFLEEKTNKQTKTKQKRNNSLQNSVLMSTLKYIPNISVYKIMIRKIKLWLVIILIVYEGKK